jgi:hypothetical protein
MQAIHGGQANHETIDAQQLAVVRRGGMRPQASVYPAAMRATRDLLRRRIPWLRTRAAWLGHLPQPTRPDHLPDSGQKIADKANRDGVAARWAAPAVQHSRAVDLARRGHDAERLRDLARSLLTAATPHDANTRYRRRTGPGMGASLSLGRLDEIPDLQRFPRGPDVVASGRLVTGAKEAAGQRYGTAGPQLGPASRTWAFSEAAL